LKSFNKLTYKYISIIRW